MSKGGEVGVEEAMFIATGRCTGASSQLSRGGAARVRDRTLSEVLDQTRRPCVWSRMTYVDIGLCARPERTELGSMFGHA